MAEFLYDVRNFRENPNEILGLSMHELGMKPFTLVWDEDHKSLLDDSDQMVGLEVPEFYIPFDNVDIARLSEHLDGVRSSRRLGRSLRHSGSETHPELAQIRAGDVPEFVRRSLVVACELREDW